MAVACSDWTTKSPLSTIKVELWYQQHALDCGQYFERESINWGIEQLAFFISDINLIQQAKKQPLMLSVNDSQSENIALLRFDNSQCDAEKLTSGEPEISVDSVSSFHRLQFTVPVAADENSQLGFTLGLPFAINHLNPLSQLSPLNMPSMFWSWRGGHKFLRLDMLSENDGWNFHLGSTGCASASAMRSPQTECVNSNTVQIRLTKQQSGERLIVHLDKLLQGQILNSKSSCLMQPDKTSCQLLMANLADNGVFEWR